MLALLNSDRAVVRKVLGGNIEAFRVLVERYGSVIHGVALARLHNVADAEDVTQETFTRFYEQLDRMAHHKHIGPWLVRVARNACVDVTRRRARETALDEGRLAASATLPDPARRELHELLWEQLQGMDVESREVLILYYFRKKRAREIAALLEISPEAAAKRVQRARDELGRRLTDYLGDELDEVRADTRRTARVMAAVIATPVGWKASAAAAGTAATATGVATGTGIAKLAALVAVVAALAAIVGVFYIDFGNRPDVDDAAATTALTAEKPAQAKPYEVLLSAKHGTTEAERDESAAPAATEEKPAEPHVCGTVEGYVYFESGEPAAHVEVWVDNRERVDFHQALAQEMAHLQLPEPFRLAARTDSTGKYVISGIPLAKLSDNGQPAYFAQSRLPGLFAREAVEANLPARVMQCNLMLRPSTRVGGTVTSTDGIPIANALVFTQEVESFEYYLAHFAITGENGRFMFDGLPAGRCRLRARAKGCLGFESDWLLPGSLDNVFELQAGVMVSGRVVDAGTSRGLPGVYVVGRAEKAGSFEERTDESGVFTVVRCLPGTYTLRVVTPPEMNLVSAGAVTLVVDAEPVAGLELKTKPGATVHGRVVYENNNKPAAGVNVYVDGRRSETDSEGAYEVAGLSGGELSARVSAKIGSRHITLYEGTIKLEPGEMTKELDLEIAEPLVWSGTVVDELGEPVRWPTVCCLSYINRSTCFRELGDEAGRFKIPKDPSFQHNKVYFQALSNAGYSVPAGPFDPNMPHSGIELTIVPSGRLEGEVLGPDGRPQEGLKVSVAPESPGALIPLGVPMVHGEPTPTTIDREVSQGRFWFERLLPGKYKIGLYDFKTLLAETDITVQAGRTARVRLTAPGVEFGAVEGFVTQAGNPLADIVVRTSFKKVLTGPDGYFLIEDLSPGLEHVSVKEPGGTVFSKWARVSAERAVRLDFKLPSGGGTIKGNLTCNGNPVPHHQIHLRPISPNEGATLYVQTGEDGAYRIDNAPEGDFEATANACGSRIRQTLRVAAGRLTRVDFVFESGAIKGAVTGVLAHERAGVAVLPAEAYTPDRSLEALAAMGNAIVTQIEITADGPFAFENVPAGEYALVAVAVPSEFAFDEEAFFSGNMRLTASEAFSVAVGDTAEINLNFSH